VLLFIALRVVCSSHHVAACATLFQLLVVIVAAYCYMFHDTLFTTD